MGLGECPGKESVKQFVRGSAAPRRVSSLIPKLSPGSSLLHSAYQQQMALS